MKRNGEILIEITEDPGRTDLFQEFEAFCSDCRKLSDFVSPKSAAITARFSEREIFRLIEAGKIHFIETDQIWICRDSLKKTVKQY